MGVEKLDTSKRGLVFIGEKGGVQNLNSFYELYWRCSFHLCNDMQKNLCNDMQENTSCGNRKYYELYPEEILCAFTNVRQNKFYWPGVHLWKWYHYERYIGRTKNAVVYELNWIRNTLGEEKLWRSLCRKIAAVFIIGTGKNDSIKKPWLDSQRELLVPLKQMEILHLISAVPQFKYVRMKLWESSLRFVSPPPKVHP